MYNVGDILICKKTFDTNSYAEFVKGDKWIIINYDPYDNSYKIENENDSNNYEWFFNTKIPESNEHLIHECFYTLSEIRKLKINTIL